jgi:hypothetical protein
VENAKLDRDDIEETSKRLKEYLPKTYKAFEFFKTEFDSADGDFEKTAQMIIGGVGTVAVFAVEFTLFKVPSLIPKYAKYLKLLR